MMIIKKGLLIEKFNITRSRIWLKEDRPSKKNMFMKIEYEVKKQKSYTCNI